MKPILRLALLAAASLLLSGCAETYASIWLWKYRRDGGYWNEYNGVPRE